MQCGVSSLSTNPDLTLSRYYCALRLYYDKV